MRHPLSVFSFKHILLAVALVYVVGISVRTSAETKTVYIYGKTDNGVFKPVHLPDGTQVKDVPACIPKEYLSRYPDYTELKKKEASCANVKMRLRVYEQKGALSEQSLSLIDERVRMLKQTAEYVEKRKASGEASGYFIPMGVRSEKSLENAEFKARCSIEPGQPISLGLPIGPVKLITYKVFAPTSPPIDDFLLSGIPAVVDDYNKIPTESTKNPFTWAARKAQLLSAVSPLLKRAGDYILVSSEAFASEQMQQKGLKSLVISVTKVEPHSCTDGEVMYFIHVGNREIRGCFLPGEAFKMFSGKIQDKLKVLEVERRTFEAERQSVSSSAKALQAEQASCL